MLQNIKAAMMLADHVQAADGRLNVIGGGWRWTGPGLSTFGIGVIIEFPWETVGDDHTVKLELIDSDGILVEIPQGEDSAPFSFQATMPVAGPPGDTRGSPVNVCMGVNVVHMQLPPGGRFEFRMEIDGEMHEDWRVGFSTRLATDGEEG